MPSFILIRPTVWPQYTNVTDMTHRQTGQWSSRIGRTVLQTVAQKLRATGSLPDSGIGYVSGVRDPEDFTELPCVKSMQSPRKSVRDSPRFRTIHQRRRIGSTT